MQRTTPGLPAKVLIANRGEIAVRIARTLRAMGIGSVAVHSDIDARALHVEVADEAVRLGGASPADSYLRADRLVEAAQRVGADAIHPGYGFLSESPAFARLVADAGVTWIGPPAEVIEAMGDKLAAKRRMGAAGVPLVPGIELGSDPDADPAEHLGADPAEHPGADPAEHLGADPDAIDLDVVAQAIGFPVMVKAAAGGGGKGMRVVHDPAELRDAIASARREALGAFGDGRVFLERFVARPRHLEVQVVGDVHGTVCHLFERECSIQRRHQKVVEETPSPGIDDRVRAALGAAALDAARAIGYVNAGTVEFIGDEAVLARLRAGDDVDPRTAFAFLEVNTRLQVEHPVTEQVVRWRDPATGGLDALDLVRLQVLVAAGEPLGFAQSDLHQRGHAIEVRLYAEDPVAGYLPATGTLHTYAPAELPGIRWDSGVRQGDDIPTHYDPMLAKVIATAPTRREAAAVLARELDRTALVGATTNRDLLVGILRDEAFLGGDTTTAFLDERFPRGTVADLLPDDATVQSAAIAAALAAATRRRADAPVLRTLRAGFTNAAAFVPAVVFDAHNGAWTVRYAEQRDGAWQVAVSPGDAPEDGGAHPDTTVHLARIHGIRTGAAATSAISIDLEIDEHRQRVRVDRHMRAAGTEIHVTTAAGRVVLSERPRFPAATGAQVAGATLAPMPGAVVEVAVAVGDEVDAGALLVSVEAMKMEHRITAPFDGVVAEVRVSPGQQVDADAVLVIVDAADAAADDVDAADAAADGVDASDTAADGATPDHDA